MHATSSSEINLMPTSYLTLLFFLPLRMFTSLKLELNLFFMFLYVPYVSFTVHSSNGFRGWKLGLEQTDRVLEGILGCLKWL